MENFSYLVKEKRPDPRKSDPHKQSTFYLVPCPNAGCTEVRWLRGHDARKNQECIRCSRRKAGAAAYQVLKARDPLFMVKAAQKNQLRKPSKPELLFMGILKSLNIAFERQYIWCDPNGKYYVLDFVLLENGQVIAAIEINGFWHTVDKVKMARDKRLADQWPKSLLTLMAKDVTLANMFTVASQVKAFHTSIRG